MKNLLLSVFIFIQLNGLAQKLTIEQYVNQYYNIAVQEMNQFKIPASITLAQGIIETESGNSDLCTKANNHFGIKCKAEWTGNTFIKDDDKKNECFRSYNSAEESFRDHSNFLLKPRYSKLFTYDMADYRSWAYGLKEAGYATNPKYPQMLIKYIEELQLFRFDKFGLNTPSSSKPKEVAKEPTIDEATLIKLRSELANNLKLVIVNENFDVYRLASENRLSVSTLMEYNDIEGEQPLRIGQNFFLEKKLKANSKHKHVTLIGESLYDISQIYGVSLKQVRKINRLEPWEQPAVGEEIYLSEQRSDVIKTRPFYEVEKERSEKNLKLFIPIALPLKQEIKTAEHPTTKIESTKPTALIIEPTVSKDTLIINTLPSNTPNTPNSTNEEKTWITHTVKPKETIFRISKNYDCKPNEILEWNGITIEQGLQVGQNLRVYTKYPKGLLENKMPPPEPLPLPTSSKKIKLIPAEKPLVKDTSNHKIVNGMRVEKVSLKDLYKSVKKDSTPIQPAEVPVKNKIIIKTE